MATLARSGNEIVIVSNGISPLIGTSMEQLTDSSGMMSVSEASTSVDYRPCTADVPGFGLGRDAHWLRFDLRNGTMEPSVMISIPYPGIDELDIFMDAGQGFRKIVHAGLARDRHLLTEGIRRQPIHALRGKGCSCSHPDPGFQAHACIGPVRGLGRRRIPFFIRA
ncbi:MAG: hypothetical protein IPI81_13125 [Flavobacteriales bacterium]|nr:hypothetical protein [Flavobacteriales bacterium]